MLNNMAGTEVGEGDSKMGQRSTVKSLGRTNPFTIQTVGSEVAAAVQVKGGKC